MGKSKLVSGSSLNWWCVRMTERLVCVLSSVREV